jgi:hypothetical protein
LKKPLHASHDWSDRRRKPGFLCHDAVAGIPETQMTLAGYGAILMLVWRSPGAQDWRGEGQSRAGQSRPLRSA